ncbi:hypothetical protein WCX49_11515 [Sulfurimonas sp. HSL-1656]|uniref:hypothetical protein n=1 Tax=Thiomicrolovo subterrani TaxID=3131934 RepID=UPI0031F7F105
MTTLRSWLFAALVAVLFGGCTMKKPPETEAYVVVFKTPQWRFADTGYIRKGDGVAELEVFEAGQRILRLQVETLVCTEGEGCLSKSAFNAKYLSADYPDDLFYHLLRGEAIMERKNLVHTDAGFEQNIGGIVYRVTPEQIYFKDFEHGILIKFKRLQ